VSSFDPNPFLAQAPPEEVTLKNAGALARDRVQVREAMMDIHHAVVARSPEALEAAFKVIHAPSRVRQPPEHQFLTPKFLSQLFDPAKDNVLADARNIAGRLDDEKKKGAHPTHNLFLLVASSRKINFFFLAEILETVNNIERLRKELEAAARYAIEHPDDPQAQQRVLDLMKQTDAEFDKLDKVIIYFLFYFFSLKMTSCSGSNITLNRSWSMRL